MCGGGGHLPAQAQLLEASCFLAEGGTSEESQAVILTLNSCPSSLPLMSREPRKEEDGAA